MNPDPDALAAWTAAVQAARDAYHHDQHDAVRRCACGVYKAADQPTCRRCQETP